MSNLRDAIRIEIERGNLTEPFNVKAVRELLGKYGGHLGGQHYDLEHVGSILANHSTGPGSRVGESVKRGGERLFIKHAPPATYSIDYGTYEIPEVDAESASVKADGKSTSSGGHQQRRPPESPTSRGDIALQFVDYIREKPFRIAENARGALVWYPTAGPVAGWNNRLHAYRWGSYSWIATVTLLGTYIVDLGSLRHSTAPLLTRQNEALRIYNAIRAWGNPRGASYTAATLLNRLSALWKTGTIADVDSTLTKLYALARPNDFVIYDSRVAAAILTVAEDIFRKRTSARGFVETVSRFQSAYPRLGHYPGPGGTRPRGYRARWPHAYRVVGAQLDANDLCGRIMARLNVLKEDGRKSWTLREVEAVLFMEGY